MSFKKLYTDNLYHKTITYHSPDRLDRFLLYARGEFGINYEIGFDRHLNRLINLSHNPIFKNNNGDKQKEITRIEPVWY